MRALVPHVEDVLAGEAAVDQRAGLELLEHAVAPGSAPGAPSTAPSAPASSSAPGPSACAGRCERPGDRARPSAPGRRGVRPLRKHRARPPSPLPGERSACSPAGAARRPRWARSVLPSHLASRAPAPARRSRGPAPPAAGRAGAPGVRPRGSGMGRLGRQEHLLPDCARWRAGTGAPCTFPSGSANSSLRASGTRAWRGHSLTPARDRRGAVALTRRGRRLWSGPPAPSHRSTEGCPVIVGVPKEIKTREYRVGMVPAGVRRSSTRGPQGARREGRRRRLRHHRRGLRARRRADRRDRRRGLEARGDDRQGEGAARARVRAHAGRARSSTPTSTWPACPELAKVLVKKKVAAVAYETIQLDDGSLPLLRPMSEVAGKMAIQVGATLPGEGARRQGHPPRRRARRAPRPRRHHRRRRGGHQRGEDRRGHGRRGHHPRRQPEPARLPRRHVPRPRRAP